MPRHLPQSTQRTDQIKAHNRKALEDKRPEDVLPEQSRTRIWEPWEWNAEIARRAKARGEKPNIAQPTLPRGFLTSMEQPEQRDLQQEMVEKNEIRKGKGRKQFKGGIKVEKPD